MDNTYIIKIDADTKNLKNVADFIEKNLKKKNIEPIVSNEILVAVDEAVTNIIKHAYKNKPGGYIRVLLKMMNDKIIISIFDKGAVFNPEKIPLPDLSPKLEERNAGGLGVFLIKKFMDEVTFYLKGTDGRVENEIRMIKYLKVS